MLKTGYCYNGCLKDVTWTRAKSNDNTIGCAGVILVSTSLLQLKDLRVGQ